MELDLKLAREGSFWLSEGTTMADPKIPEHNLNSQGQVYKRASKTDEKTSEIGSEYRGHGATPQQKADEKKPWISEGHTGANVDDQNRDESSRPQPDTYAQEVNKRLGPVTSAKDKIVDSLETAMEKVSGTSKSASETAGEAKTSAAGTFSQYTQAAWDKMNELKPTIGANEPPKEDKKSSLHQRMAEISEKGQHDTSAIAEKAKDKTPSVPDVGHKLLAAGGDDVMKILADGGSTQDDPLKANMRVTTEMLI